MKAEKRDYQDFLNDILYLIDKIGHFIEGFDSNDFAEDKKTIFAVVRVLEKNHWRSDKEST